MNIKDLIKVTALGALVASTGAIAADGSLSTTSSNATAEVTGVIPSMIQILNLGDGSDQFDLGTYNPAAPADMVALETFCVYRNNAGRGYGISISGDGGLTAGTQFEIDNGTVEIAYTVAFNDDDGVAVVSYPTPATPLTTQVGNAAPDCSGAGNTAHLEVRVAQAVAAAAQAGTYTGDLTVTVTAE